MELTPLYHWSPSDRREAIRQDGLRPRQPSTVTRDFIQPHVCLGPDPQTAWSISGAMTWVADIEQWDLWMVHVGKKDSVHVLPEFGARIREIHVSNPIPANRIWLVGTRDSTGIH
jgi:hypothetical protein